MEKYQHFVSRMQLVRFTDANGRIHAWSDRANRILSQVPSKMFGQTHLYSTENEAGEKDTWFEKQLSALESASRPLLARIVDAAANDLAPTLSPDDKRTLDRFFYTQWKRVPDFFETAPWIAAGQAAIDSILAELRARFPDRLEEIDAENTPEKRKRILQTGKIQGISTDSERILDLFDRRGLMVLRLPPGGPGFVIGSLPIVRTSKSLEQDGGEAWMPITPRLLIGPGMERGSVDLGDYDPDQVEMFNRIVANQSTMFGGPDLSQTEELAAWRHLHRQRAA